VTSSPLRLALVEAFYGGSHRAWASGYRASSLHDVHLFTLPDTNWQWRLRGASVTLAEQFMAAVEREGPFDAVLASDMVDLAGFAGIARRHVGGAPLVLYMHENQLTYPIAVGGPDNSAFARINWRSMRTADAVWFNSRFHLEDWFSALPGLLKRAPDHQHLDLIESTRERSEVMPVGVDLHRLDGPATPSSRTRLIWNQRWEHDKDPDALATGIVRLVAQGVDIDVIICGEAAGDVPHSLHDLQQRLADRVVHFGYASPEEYAELLRSADIVVSTARQEYFGIAITEAIYCGAFPVLPDRLVYPERLPEDVHARCLYRDLGGLIERVKWAVEHPKEAAAITATLRPRMEVYDWSMLAPRYDAALTDLVDRVSPRR
jgi:glycosyltransferase involved in cell wall biosynthesis